MNTEAVSRCGMVAFAIVAAMMILFPAMVRGEAMLETADQQAIETRALSLREEPAIIAAREAALKRYRATPWYVKEDGRKLLEEAVDELLYGVLLVAAGDPADPKIVWSVTLPRRAGQRQLPGSRYGGDSPDRIYRGVAIDSHYRYEIRGRQIVDKTRRPTYFSIEAIPEPILWGLPPLAVLSSENIDIGKDGSFTITADAEPGNGRRNHIQLPPAAAMLLIRDTIPDWERQVANALTIRRVDATPATPLARDAMIRHAVSLLDKAVSASLKFYEGLWGRPPNQLHPYVRDLGWGMLASNSFSLADDEALIVTLDPVSARYLSLQSMDLWMRSIPYDVHMSSLNEGQAQPNADGSFTYVISKRDPGVYNWIDAGYNDGLIVARWESLTRPAEPKSAVRELRKLPLAAVAAALPDIKRVNAVERKQQLVDRGDSYRKRLDE